MPRIIGLLALFFVIGGPGGGGHGGYGSSNGISGGSGGNHGGSSFHPPIPTIANSRIPLVGWVVIILLFMGLIAVLELFVKSRGRNWLQRRLVRPTALQPVTMVVLLVNDTVAHITAFDSILRSGDFTAPSQRAARLRRLSTRIASAAFYRAYYKQMPCQPTAHNAAIVAETLAKQQRERADAKREPDPNDGIHCCVVGVTITVTPELFAKLARFSDDIYACYALWGKLRTASIASLDAVYLFYSPAPGETLTLAQGEAMLSDLRAMTA